MLFRVELHMSLIPGKAFFVKLKSEYVDATTDSYLQGHNGTSGGAFFNNPDILADFGWRR
jgi:hypothetical protein